MDTPIGTIAIIIREGMLCGIDFLPGTPVNGATSEDPLEREVVRQLTAYFQDGRTCFCLPLGFRGTGFQNRVWLSLGQIGPGQVRSYGAIARQLDSSPQAVGNACRQNSIPILVACHRVISPRGIGGYGGEMRGTKLQMKRWLLSHEGIS